MGHYKDVMNYFKQSESEAAVELRKFKAAQLILKGLNKLKEDIAKINSNYECEAAVVHAQQIIDGE